MAMITAPVPVRNTVIYRVLKELQDFEHTIYSDLLTYIINNINFDYLRELDELDNRSIDYIDSISHQLTEKLCEKYKYTEVKNIYDKITFMLNVMMFASLNVHTHVIPEMQNQAMVDNIIYTYHKKIYKNLLIESLYINLKASVIQRKWIECINDTAHPIKRKMVDREYAELTKLYNSKMNGSE